MTESHLKTPWLPFGTNPDAGVRLLLLPHAGAGASVYRGWGAGFPVGVGACPVQPPGREQRRGEQPLRTVESIVELLAPEVLASVRPPYAIFGHSVGALCAFELARKIRVLGGPEPAHLFVAGRRAPHLPVERTGLSGIPLSKLAGVLRNLGGTPEEVLASQDMLRMIQPLLAADYTVNEAYEYRSTAPLDIPITSFAATEDAETSLPQMAEWEAMTTAPFNMHIVTGGHFAIFDHGEEVRDRITAALHPFQ
jgi:medium-chain acyl-[acyl-carrier-protein] hydrolase